MRKYLIPFVILVLIILPAILPFFNNRFFYTQDYIYIARLQQMSTALMSSQFPVRWAFDVRFGEPVFDYYAPLPYDLGAVIHLVGFDFIWVAKLLFVLSAILSAVAMYVLANYLFGKKAGVLSAILYTYAPYKAVDMYVRGALSETWAFVFFPLIFYFSARLSKKISYKNFVFLALSLAGLFLTHNVTTLMFLPFFALWCIYLIVKEKNWKVALFLLLVGIFGLGLSASFLLPAIFERDLIQTKYLIVGYFNFRAHFVAVGQFFSLFWGYGSSLWGLDDGLSFQIGLVNVVVLVLSVILGVIYRKDKKFLILLGVLGISFFISIFLQHNKSAFIWEAFPIMAFIQFPWRFLGITVFIVSLTGAAITPYLKNKLLPVYFILLIAAIVSTVMYFKPKEYVENNFFDKFLNVESMRKGVDLTKDYLPIWVSTVDGDVFTVPRAEKGKIEISNLKRSSTSLSANIISTQDSLIEAPITYFPGWQVSVNSKQLKLGSPSIQGLIRFDLPKGEYRLQIDFRNTFIRSLGNIISLTFILAIIFGFIKKYIFK